MLSELGAHRVMSPYVKYYYPLFNFDHVNEICEKCGLPKPVECHPEGSGWWHKYDYNTRIAVIKEIIKELEAK